MFVDLLTPSTWCSRSLHSHFITRRKLKHQRSNTGTKSQDLKSLFKTLEVIHDQLERLRAKTSIAAASVSMHQICASVEHFVLSLDLETVQWTNKFETYEERRKLLLLIHGLAIHYVSACLSLPSDSAVFSRRALTMTTLFVLFDSIVRIPCSSGSKKKEKKEVEEATPDDGSHILTDILNNGVMRTPEGVSVGAPSAKEDDKKTPPPSVRSV